MVLVAKFGSFWNSFFKFRLKVSRSLFLTWSNLETTCLICKSSVIISWHELQFFNPLASFEISSIMKQRDPFNLFIVPRWWIPPRKSMVFNTHFTLNHWKTCCINKVPCILFSYKFAITTLEVEHDNCKRSTKLQSYSNLYNKLTMYDQLLHQGLC